VELYIVRHATAEPRGQGPDEERALTPKGSARAAEVARGLRALGCRPERVLTSPLRRAEQTARILAETLCPDAPFEMCERLAPGASAEQLATELAGAVEGSVMVVGHAPDVTDIAAGLVCGRCGLDIAFKKAAACCISFRSGPVLGEGRLEWLLQPSHLRALGRKG
jgi:phosphohistidine phosphatase